MYSQIFNLAKYLTMLFTDFILVAGEKAEKDEMAA
jgi:hypothetical protein